VFRYRREDSEFRQFHQAGVELIGSDGSQADAEALTLACQGLSAVGVDSFTLVLGDLGIYNRLASELALSERARVFLLDNVSKLSDGVDGFVSVDGPYEGWGELTTRPLLFQGKELELNYKTSGGGVIQVEIQNEQGEKLDGFHLEDCIPLVGNRIGGVVKWKTGSELSSLAGMPVRLRVRLRDAGIYAFRFRP
jgi:ATP phosphoribosyltransferase regulatory subunit HisZ